MQKWAYKVVTVYNGNVYFDDTKDSKKEIEIPAEDIANRLGVEGWEAVCSYASYTHVSKQKGWGNVVCILFKRPSP